MSAKLTLESVEGIRTDDGVGSSEWNLDINVFASQDPAVGFKTIHFDADGVDSGDKFTGSGLHEAVGGAENLEITIPSAREGTYFPDLSIFTIGLEDDPVSDEPLPTTSIGPLHYHDQDFVMTAADDDFSYTLKWNLEVNDETFIA